MLCVALLGLAALAGVSLAESGKAPPGNAAAGSGQVPKEIEEFLEDLESGKVSVPAVPAKDVTEEQIGKGRAAPPPQAQGVPADPGAGTAAVPPDYGAQNPLALPSLPPSEPEKPFEISELFSIEENPGTGSLFIEQGAEREEIKLGAETGHYGIGLVFDSLALPQPHRHEFGRQLIMQVAFGTSQTKLQGRIPQFGVATLFTARIPTRKTTYFFRVKVPGKGTDREGAMLLFSSPSSKQSQSDEERLRGTFFAPQGILKVTPSSQSRVASTNTRGKRMSFKARLMELEFDALLGTPFNTQIEPRLRGTVKVPVYWPANAAALEMVTSLAARSLDEGTNDPSSKRAPAGKPRK